MDGAPLRALERKRLPGLQRAVIALGAVALALLLYKSLTAAHDHLPVEHGPHAHVPGLWSVIPFAALLLSIAVLPLIPVTSHWWEHNQNRLAVSLILAGVTLLYYLLSYGVE